MAGHADMAVGEVDHMLEARQAAGHPRGRWGGRLAMAVSVYHLGRQAHAGFTKWRDRQSYTVTLMEGDEVYDLVQGWLLQHMPDGAQRALVARTSHAHRRQRHALVEPDTPMEHASDEEAEANTRKVGLHYDGTRVQTLQLGSYEVKVRIERDESGERGGRDGEYIYKPRKVIFTTDSLAGRRAVVDLLQHIADQLVSDGKRTPRLIAADRWGNWRGVRHLQDRPLDTVVLPEGHLDGITTDLRRFLSNEARYRHLGVPWHRGYLFHGPPGTGKTSTARALSSSLGLDVYYVSLSDLESSGALSELVGRVPERSVLLLEDVDVAHAATDRDDDRKGVTLDGLLNVLDGVATPHGLVVIMTTNERDALDPALVRPGRVDYEVEMTYLVPEQYERLVRQLTGGAVFVSAPDIDRWPQLTAAEVVGCATDHMHDPNRAFIAMDQMLATKMKAE